MTGAELMLGLARGTQVAATMSVFGSMWFRAILPGPAPVAAASSEPPPPRQVLQHRLLRLTTISLVLAIFAGLPWLLLQTASLIDEPTAGEIGATLPIVLFETHFGPLIGSRLALLLIAWLLFRRTAGHPVDRSARWAATLLAGSAVLLQIGLGHGLSMEDGTRTVLIIAEAGHLLSAAIWLGGLLPLLITVATLPPAEAHAIVCRFSRLAMFCVAVLLVTIVVQSWALIGSLPGFIGTDYGSLAVLKGLFLLALLLCAGLNRWRFMPKLPGADAAAGQRQLRRSIAIESIIGLAVLLAAGTLLTLAPAIHQQPDWPFADRFSLETAGDPDLRDEILRGTGQAIGAVICLGLAIALLWWRGAKLLRWCLRGGFAAGALLLAWFAASHLDLLLVPAYPTSFYTSPTGFTGASIVSGAKLFADNCTTCHGAEGRGDGPQAKGMTISPADLTAQHLFGHSDGELFWWLGHGIEGPDGHLVMPGFAAELDDDDRWALIDYIRAHNAGLAMRMTGSWPQPMAAPDMTASWQGQAMPLSSLHGHFLRLVATGDKAPPAAPANTIPPLMSLAIRPQSDAWNAYAIIAGVTPEQLAGTQFLVDDNGWLRAVLYPTGTDWADAASIVKALQDAATHPLATAGSAHHHHPS